MNQKTVVTISVVVAVAIVVSLAVTLVGVGIVPPGINPSSPTDTQSVLDAGLGLVVNTPTTAPDLQTVRDVYSEAASAGIGRSNVYMFWDIIEPERGEFDWRRYDTLMSLNRNNDLKVTLYFSLINGKTLGPFPDWIGRPGLISVDAGQVARTLDAVLDRYHIVDTVIIAGETDEHFRYSKQEIPVYRELFGEVYSRLKQEHPDVMVGNMYSLHGVINKDLGHVVEELGGMGDFVGFTYFPVDSLNDITKTPEEAVQDLRRALELAGGQQVGFFELGWSTSGFVNGSEADQRRFVAEAMEFYGQNSGDVEFMTWYRQYDRPEGSCTFDVEVGENQVAVGGGSGMGSSEHVAERLGHYVCSSGLIGTDGTPKAGWGEFVRAVGDVRTPPPSG